MLIYLHIPKTGGTSMLECLSRVYGPYSKQPNPYIWWAGNNALREARTQMVPECLFGHLSYGDAEFSLKAAVDARYMVNIQHPVVRFSYATMLRHPVDRVVSMFYYKRSLEGGGFEPFEKMGLNKNATLLEYVSQAADKGLFNAQTAQLAGIVLDDNFNPTRTPSQIDFVVARQNLNNITVGLTERFEQSLHYFAQQFGWPKVPKASHENKVKHPPAHQHNPEAIKLILEYNKFDLLLYDMAREKLLS